MKYLYNYVYKITDKIENKFYIGVRSTNKEPILDLLKYKSSSKDIIFKTLQNIDQERFDYEIIDIYTSRTLANMLEINLHNLFQVSKNPRYINRAISKSDKFCTLGQSSGMKGKKVSSETIKKTLNTKANWTEEQIKSNNTNISNKVKIWHDNMTEEEKNTRVDKCRQATLNFYKSLSEEEKIIRKEQSVAKLRETRALNPDFYKEVSRIAGEKYRNKSKEEKKLISEKALNTKYKNLPPKFLLIHKDNHILFRLNKELNEYCKIHNLSYKALIIREGTDYKKIDETYYDGDKICQRAINTIGCIIRRVKRIKL